jgi:hypothetical protein
VVDVFSVIRRLAINGLRGSGWTRSGGNESLRIPAREVSTVNGAAGSYRQLTERFPRLCRRLNCGTGFSFLNALVNVFRLHIIFGENSGYSGSKYRWWTSGSKLLGASSLPSTNAE